MEPVEAHRRAQAAFARVLAHVKPDQYDDPSPCTQWSIRALIDHVIAGNQLVVQRAGGEPATLPDDRVTAHRRSADAAQAVFAAPDGLTRMFELAIGTLPGSAFVAIRTGDALTHAWDLARATGQPTDLDPELAEQTLQFSRGLIGSSLRGPDRFFGEEQPCDEDRPAADRLAAFLGRVV